MIKSFLSRAFAREAKGTTAMSSAYVYNPGRVSMTFAEARDALARRFPKVVTGEVQSGSDEHMTRVIDLGRQCGISFDEYRIDLDAYRAYMAAADYEGRFATYYAGNRAEKSLEHFIAYELLALGRGEIFIDIASENSPVPDIYWRLAGCCSFYQDITFAEGIRGNQIGGDACAMPVPDGFAAKASLHCSLEHFENDADVRLFAELRRVLKPGGAVCIVPFYLYDEDCTQTDPLVSLSADVRFDEGTTIYCAQNWGNRHGRFYAPATFKRKIADRFSADFGFRYFHIANAPEVSPAAYARFALLATRLPQRAADAAPR